MLETGYHMRVYQLSLLSLLCRRVGGLGPVPGSLRRGFGLRIIGGVT